MHRLQEKKPSLVIIVGPTGIGKSQLALELAGEFGGEIVGADSMQVYRFMDIGTSKPTLRDREGIPHHLIDVVDPDVPFNAARYAALAQEAVESIIERGRQVFIVGGTGLYIRALVDGIFSGPGADEGIRAFYREELRRHGKGHLYGLLKDKDEKAARRIDPHDSVRIIRALEVWDQCGRSIVDLREEQRSGSRPYRCLKIGLAVPREELFRRIERRAETMIESGLVAEVEGLLARGYARSLKSMQALGYKHIANYLSGAYDLGEAVRLMKRDTRNYAKRQLTWFCADSEVRWLSGGDAQAARSLLRNYLTSGGYNDN